MIIMGNLKSYCYVTADVLANPYRKDSRVVLYKPDEFSELPKFCWLPWQPKVDDGNNINKKSCHHNLCGQ